MTTQNQPSPVQELLLTVENLRTRWKFWTGTRLAGHLLLLWTTGILLLWLYDTWTPLSETTRIVCWTLTLTAGLAWFGWRVRQLFQPISSHEIAAMIESTYPQLQEELISAIEFCETPGEQGIERRIQQRCIQLADRKLQQLDLKKVLQPSRSRRTWLLLTILGIGFGFFLWSTPETRSPWSRVLIPWNDHLLPPQLEVLGGNRTVARGAEVTLQARFLDPQNNDPLSLHWGNEQETWAELPLEYHPESKLYSTTLYQVENSFQFQVRSARDKSSVYKINVVDSPQIQSAKLIVTPPEYTAAEKSVHDGAFGNIAVIANSQVEFLLQTNKPLQSASVHLLSDNGTAIQKKLPLTKSANSPDSTSQSWKTSLTATRSQRFIFHFVDLDGLEFKDTTRRNLKVVGDLPPEISFLQASLEQTETGNSSQLTLPLNVTDDHSPESAEFILQLPDQPAEVFKPVSTETLSPQEKQYLFHTELTTAELNQADRIMVKARATDNRDIPRPNETWTEEQTLQSLLPTTNSEELAQLAAEQDANLQKSLAEVHQALEQQQEQFQKLNLNSTQPALPEQQQQTLNEMIEKQNQLSVNLEQIAQELNQQSLYQELVSPTQQTAREQLPTASAELKSSLQTNTNPDQTATHLENAQKQIQQATQQVGQIRSWLEDLINLKQESSQLNQLAQQSQNLANQLNQSATSPSSPSAGNENTTNSNNSSSDNPDASPANNADQPAPSQSDLQQQADQLAASMEDLLDRHPEITAAAQEAQRRALREMSQQLKQLASREEQLQKSVKADLHAQQQRKNSPENENADSPQPFSEIKQQMQQLQQQQQRLARRAASMTMSTVAESGLQSEAARSALEMLKQTEAASQSAQAGDLDSAAKSSSQAAKQTEETLAQQQPEDQTAQQLKQLADQQQGIAEQFEQLANNPDARHAARQLGQESLRKSVQQIEQQLQSATDSLTDPTNPASQPELAPGLERSRGSLSQAKQAMQNAESQLEKRDYLLARQSTRSAMQLLQQSSKSLWEVSGEKSGETSPVPQSFAEQLAQAAEQLKAAQQKLKQQKLKQQKLKQQQLNQQQSPTANSDSNPPNPDSKSDPQSKPESNGNDQSDDAEGQQGGQQAGQQQAAKNLENASESLNNASEDLQPGQAQNGQQKSSGNANEDQAQSGPEGQGGGEGTTQGLLPGDVLAEIEYFSSRKWGEVSTELKSEIRQAKRFRNKPEYARQIKSYFKSIATPHSPRQKSNGGTK